MSEQGWVVSVGVEPVGTHLATAALAGDMTLSVDYAGEFDPDGGTLDLAGTRLDYTGFTSGATDDDPDVFDLSAPLAVGAEEDTVVAVVLGGEVATECTALVSLGDGDNVEVTLPFEQRPLWPVGSYDPPVPVHVSDDLMRIETVPYREAMVKGSASGVKFRNTDTFTATAGEDLEGMLTYQPIDGSVHVVAAGVPQIAGVDWTRARRSLVVTDAGWADNRTVSVSYAYDPTDQPPVSSPNITSPGDGATVTDTTPIISGTGEPGYTITVDLDAAEIGTTTVAADGTWSVQVAAVLNDGDHTATATQTGPDAYAETASVTFHTQAPVFVPTVRGVSQIGGGSTTDDGDSTHINIPAGTLAGDFFVLAMTSFGGTASSSDARIDGGQTDLADGDSSRHSSVYWGTTDGSGTALSIDLTGSASRATATLVVYTGSGQVVSQQIVGPSTGATPAVLGADTAIAAMVGVNGQIDDSGSVYTADGGATDGLYFSRIFHCVGDAPATTFTNTYAGMALGVNGV